LLKIVYAKNKSIKLKCLSKAFSLFLKNKLQRKEKKINKKIFAGNGSGLVLKTIKEEWEKK